MARDSTAKDSAALYEDVLAYDQMGEHRTGTLADNACSIWLRKRLARFGFDVELQPLSVTAFEPRVCRLDAGALPIDAFPAWPVRPTPPSGLRGPLSFVADQPLDGKIALVRLAYSQDSDWTPKRRDAVMQAAHRGAIAVLVVTDGPTGGIIAFNSAPDGFEWPVPVVLVGGKQDQTLVNAVRTASMATLVSTRSVLPGPASNVVARRTGPGKSIVISTPKSGWFNCAGERGSGIAMFLALARWLPEATDRSLVFVATSGHELGGLGADEFVKTSAPAPDKVGLWLHIGANVAVQNISIEDGIVGVGSPVILRSLFVGADLATIAKQAFAGIPGYSEPTLFTSGALPGDLEIFRLAGYPRLTGMVGLNPLFHTRFDRAEVATTPEILGSVYRGMRSFLRALL